MLTGEFFQMGAHKSGQSRIPLDRQFADLFDQLVIERERDIHEPIIRETLITCKRMMGELIP